MTTSASTISTVALPPASKRVNFTGSLTDPARPAKGTAKGVSAPEESAFLRHA